MPTLCLLHDFRINQQTHVACRLCDLALDNVTEERRALERGDSESICFRISSPAMKLLQRVAESHCGVFSSQRLGPAQEGQNC